MSVEQLLQVPTTPFFTEDIFATVEDSGYQRFRKAGICAQILHHLNADQIRVASNKPRCLIGLEKFGVNIAGEISFNTAR
jgi:GTP cyclohydrolase II